MGAMQIACNAGDIVVEWDPEDARSIDNAHAEWKRLKADGYEFYEPGEGELKGKGRRVTRWDKTRAKVLAMPGVKRAAERKDPALPRSRAMAGGPVERFERL